MWGSRVQESSVDWLEDFIGSWAQGLAYGVYRI